MSFRVEKRQSRFVDASKFFEKQEQIRTERKIPNHIRPLPFKRLEREHSLVSLPDGQLLPELTPRQEEFLRLYLKGETYITIAEECDVNISYVVKTLGVIRRIAKVPKKLRRVETMEYLQQLIEAHHSNIT